MSTNPYDTYALAESIAGQILDEFEQDMRRAGANTCACCNGKVVWPCAMGFWHLGGAQIVCYPLCYPCAEKAQTSRAGRRAVGMRVKAYIRRAMRGQHAQA